MFSHPEVTFLLQTEARAARTRNARPAPARRRAGLSWPVPAWPACQNLIKEES